MRSTQIADALLMLVTSRERAVTTVGDLLEESSGRAGLWFWSSILRTAISQFWRGITSESWYLAGLALRAVVLNFALWVASFVGFVACGTLIFGALQAMGVVHGNSASFPRAAEAYFTVLGLAIQFQLGRWLARRAADCALGACVMFVAEWSIATAILSAAILVWSTGHIPDAVAREPVAPLEILFPFGLARTVLYSVPLVGGAWMARRRAELHTRSRLVSG